jgi:hypothetical protein
MFAIIDERIKAAYHQMNQNISRKSTLRKCTEILRKVKIFTMKKINIKWN